VNLSTIDINATLLEIERLECEESLGTFLRRGWKYMDPAPFVDGWAIDAVSEHLMAVCDGEIRDLIINIPPRCLKSIQCGVAFPAWVWAQRYRSHTSGPGVKFLYASYADRLSLRDSVRCRRLIESPWYEKLWGDRYNLSKDQNAKHRFSNSIGGERLITSISAGVTGEGGDIIIADDPNATKNMEKADAAAPAEVIEWWDSAMPTRRNNPKLSARIVIQQRISENDLTGHILEHNQGSWCHLMLPMRFEPLRSVQTVIGWEDPRTEEGELLWPERFGETELVALERELRGRAPGQLQQRPEPQGGGIIKREWWEVWEHESYPAFDYIIASLDTAYTEKTENDFSALTIWGVFTDASPSQASKVSPRDASERARTVLQTANERTPKVMLMNAWQDRLELHDLVKKVEKTCRDGKGKFFVDMLLIENKAAGISVAQELRRLFSSSGLNVQLDDPRSIDKTARLHSVSHFFEEGLVFAPERSWSDAVITQAANFPKAKHDDLVDTVSQALRKLRQMRILERAPEIEADQREMMKHQGKPPAPLYPV
jgi:predicted phage terminase large subunit-like protein